MRRRADPTYPPLNTLKPVADNVWIVDGPVIRFGPRLFRFPFPTRMTVLRLARGLFIHSPTPLTESLRREIETAGKVRWIVGPNRIHYWWIPEWHAAFADAQVYLAPRIREQAGERIDFDCRSLDRDGGYPWDDEVATLPVPGRYMTEVAFFHRASHTLILTDLIENFEAHKLPLLMRTLARLGGARHPDGQTPRDMRLTLSRAEMRRAAETMIGWNPERVVIAHGRWYAENGAAELRRAFRWALGESRAG